MRAWSTAALVLASTASAHADTITTTTTVTTTVDLDATRLQPPGETPPVTPAARLDAPQFRLGVAAGAALGFDTKDDCASGQCVGFHVQLATSIAPHLLATLGSSVMTIAGDDKGLHNGVHHVETAGLQYWASPRLWAEAGLGVGSKRSWSTENPHDIVNFMDADGWAPAGSLAVGYTAWRTGTYGFDIEARVASTDDIHHTAFAQLMLGVDYF